MADPLTYTYIATLIEKFLLTSNRIGGSHAIDLVKSLVRDGGEPQDIRIALVRLARCISGTYSQAIQASATARQELESVRSQLLESEDGVLRVLGYDM